MLLSFTKQTSHVKLKLSSYKYSCHFHNVTCKVDEVFQPPVGHSHHNLQIKLGLIHTDIPLINEMLVEHTQSHS